MPNLSDIMEMAEALETKAIILVPDRCVAVRNRNATCRKCVDACPSFGALSVQDNKLDFDGSLCVSCGACTVVCPTEALVPTKPLDVDMAEGIARSCLAAHGSAVFACARIAARHEGDPEKYQEVPCLARMEESVLIELAAHAAVTSITLVDGVCATCKYRAVDAGIDATVTSTNALLAAWGSPVVLERVSAFPDRILLADNVAEAFGVSRRGFFSHTKSAAKDTAKKTVVKALKPEEVEATIQERLRVSDNGSLPQFNALRRMNILNALDRIGQPQVDEVGTRLWGTVEIDTEVCSGCGMCVVFCPTGALKKSEVEPEDGEGSYLEFSLADCVQCNACSDICLHACIRVVPTISTAELLDFEPRLLALPKPPTNRGILSGLKR
ncbi:MAG: 4Fe-4S binding protein [Raoultibacter sp.]